MRPIKLLTLALTATVAAACQGPANQGEICCPMTGTANPAGFSPPPAAAIMATGVSIQAVDEPVTVRAMAYELNSDGDFTGELIEVASTQTDPANGHTYTMELPDSVTGYERLVIQAELNGVPTYAIPSAIPTSGETLLAPPVDYETNMEALVERHAVLPGPHHGDIGNAASLHRHMLRASVGRDTAGAMHDSSDNGDIMGEAGASAAKEQQGEAGYYKALWAAHEKGPEFDAMWSDYEGFVHEAMAEADAAANAEAIPLDKDGVRLSLRDWLLGRVLGLIGSGNPQWLTLCELALAQQVRADTAIWSQRTIRENATTGQFDATRRDWTTKKLIAHEGIWHGVGTDPFGFLAGEEDLTGQAPPMFNAAALAKGENDNGVPVATVWTNYRSRVSWDNIFTDNMVQARHQELWALLKGTGDLGPVAVLTAHRELKKAIQNTPPPDGEATWFNSEQGNTLMHCAAYFTMVNDEASAGLQ
jgi:hypothetical protein